MGSTWSIISRVVCVYTKKSTSGTFINIDTTSRLLTISHFYKLIPFVTNAFVGSSGIHTSTMLSTIYLTKMIKDRYFNAYFVLAFCIIILRHSLFQKKLYLHFLPCIHQHQHKSGPIHLQRYDTHHYNYTHIQAPTIFLKMQIMQISMFRLICNFNCTEKILEKLFRLSIPC